jgi:hypothetical protein
MKGRELITLLWLLMILRPTPVWAQEDHVVTAQTSSSNRADACTSSTGKVYNLCIIQGWFNVTRVICECTQSEAPGPADVIQQRRLIAPRLLLAHADEVIE